ncbi:prepilin-type N-terminal cleavage/methylation domain-containing protein [Eubacteriales bacterium OttesenSCG-928-K08]|nr:prepilin-type N-terminal cleavage/methylation domain-containing protein [Eubacteriales bacterium OttesenSCG-928-K08]
MKFTSMLKNKRGFTLIESTLTLAIIATLAAISIGPVSGYIKSAEHAAAQAEAKQLRDNLQILQIYDAAGEDDLFCDGLLTVKGYARLRSLAGLNEGAYPNGFINEIALDSVGNILNMSYYSPIANDSILWEQGLLTLTNP